jgi:Protein of unknown function (DUF3551)
MRRTAKVMVAALVVLPTLLTQNPSNALPYDPYPWWAQYSGSAGDATNCGFSTIEQCRATVSGIGGSCVPKQFYNRDKRLPGEDLNDDTDLISERSTYSASCSGCSRIDRQLSSGPE